MIKTSVFILVLFSVFSVKAFSPKYVNESYFVEDSKNTYFNLLSSREEFTIDHIHDNGYEVHGPKGTGLYLEKIGVPYIQVEIGNEKGLDYPQFTEIENELKSLANHYENLTNLYSIGKSVEGRDLWVMKIATDAKKTTDNRKAFKYIANMHGDEIVGRELMIRFIRDMLENYGQDQRISDLLENTQIHILVSMNPDGAQRRRRGNARNIDLNRSFPDFTTRDNSNTTTGRPPETVAVMNWQKQHNFLLSANFHGGAEVVNYPWDTSRNPFPHEALVKDLSTEYANLAPYIGSSRQFTGGITNGYEWYEVNGGMQDWSYYWHADIQITVELSDSKWPNYSMIDYYYEQNRESLITYIERIHSLP